MTKKRHPSSEEVYPMACQSNWVLALAVLGAGLAPAVQAGGPPARKSQDPARRMAARIDEFIDAGIAKVKAKAAPPASDAAFLRRLSLDVTGKIPRVADVRRFLSEKSSEKRARAIERLLDSPGYTNHMTNVYRGLLIPEASADFNRLYLLPSMERWLRKQFSDNVPYDRMVRELISMPFGNRNDAMNFFNYAYNGGGPITPMSFYMAKEGKAEELAATTARLFLGVRLECAQCHDHPFGKWTREQFWSQAAFFAGIKRPRGDFFFGPLTEAADKRELNIPNTDRVAQARFLDGKEPRWKYKVGARTTLAEWITAPDNPFFARAAVNRMWAHFFGVGLVDPVDDFSDTNEPSHPELLDELARQFVANKFDLKFLVRAITLSKAYQRDSAAGPTAPELRLFARMPIKGLTGEQLYDSLSVATGFRDPFGGRQRFFFFGSPRQQFLDKFTAQERRTESHTSIPQALTLMNNKLITDAVNPDRSVVLGAIAAASFMSTAGKVEALFLAALSRKPRSDEMARYSRYVEEGGVSGSKKKALSDVFWVLLNSTEFVLNH
jgi:hypothetical protein